MPTPPETPADMNRQEARISRKILQARLALGFERLWNALHWPVVIMGVAAVLVVGGLLPLLPVWPRLAVLAVLALALLWSLKDMLRIRWPGRHEAMRRVEETSGLAHRPVSAHEDRLAEGSAAPLPSRMCFSAIFHRGNTTTLIACTVTTSEGESHK